MADKTETPGEKHPHSDGENSYTCRIAASASDQVCEETFSKQLKDSGADYVLQNLKDIRDMIAVLSVRFEV